MLMTAHSQPPPRTFEELERTAWIAKAATYDGSLTRVTNQAIDPILDSFGPVAGRRLLDIACGPGHLAGAATRRGAIAEGIDFASTMVAIAAANYPEATFREGDAEALPYEDGRFDYVACAFGLHHMAHPEAAIAEASRVLRIGGRYTFTVWCAPEQGGDFLRLVLEAIRAHGTLEVGLPPAPPLFRFADPNECHRVLANAGLVASTISTVPLTWYAGTPRDALDLIYNSQVRLSMILDAQAPDARHRIHEAILAGAERHRVGDRIAIALPARMASATKP
jgi:SAM-dependent methyltransferase